MDLSDQASSRNDGVEDTSPNVVMLKHPNGSQVSLPHFPSVYLVATAHISAQSQEDVTTTIEKTNPSYVVLELDKERLDKITEAADKGDRYGLMRARNVSLSSLVGMALSGELLPFVFGTVYVISGATMGTRPGGEFLAGVEAAQRVGAEIICADRDQKTTMRRLQWYARHLDAQRRRPHHHPPGRWPRAGEAPSTAGLEPGQDPGAFPSVLQSRGALEDRDAGLDVTAERARAETEASPAVKDNPWGLSDEDDTDSAMKARLLKLMQEGGCERPNQVLEAAQRLLRDGLDSKSRGVNPADVLEIRRCGTTLIENFRTRAVRGDAVWAQEIEVEAVAGAKGALGARRSGSAMRKVIVDERDLILARRLWETAEGAGPSSAVVGIVGAGHVKGIQRYWDAAGTLEAAQRADEFLQLPPGEGPPSMVGVAVTGAVLGWMAYRRPKAMAIFAGAVTVMTVPYVAFGVTAMRRVSALAEKVVAAANTIEQGFDDGGMVEGFDGGGSGGEEW